MFTIPWSRNIILLGLLLLTLLSCKEHPQLINEQEAKHLYHSIPGANKINERVFISGVSQFRKYDGAKNYDLLTIVDFTKPSTEERLFVIDLKKKSILFWSLCSHGINSGELYAREFSNKRKSYKSSQGFYLTDEVYQGKHGTSLRLVGLEKGKNNNAKRRGIVLHGADYCSEEYIAKNGMLGRSKGCPAVPNENITPLINLLKAGSILYIHVK